MNRKPYEERNGDWICDKCRYTNFGWRFQCNQCKIGDRANPTRSNGAGGNPTMSKDQGGSGVGTALLVGAGLAAVGFVAQGLWSAFSESSSKPQRTPSNSSVQKK